MNSFCEKVDMVIFKKIIDNFDILFDSGKLGRFVDKNYKVIDNKDSVKTIIKKMYLNKIKNGMEVEYRFVGKETEGRLYSKIASLQGISRVIRHSIAKDFYWDIDMKNAHPVILRFYCEENNIPCSKLIYYNENRDICFTSLMDTHKISRDEAKRIPLTSINGGFIKDNNPKWMLDLHEELFEIRKAICLLNPKYVERATKNHENKEKARNATLLNPKNKPQNKTLFKNIEGSACNYMLCKYENIILQCAITKIKELGFEVGALVFDGFMCYKKDKTIIEDILPIIEQTILENTRIPIKLDIKEMDEGLNLSDFEVNDIPISLEEGVIRTGSYVEESIFEDGNIICIKAGLGRGKTTASIQYINKNHFDTIFILTPRKTYANSIVERFNKDSKYEFELYSDSKVFYIEKPTYIVIQCESLHRLCNYDISKLCVIIDESESFLTQLTSNKTHKKNHLQNIRIFEMLCFSKKVICMDAFMSNKTFDLFRDLRLNPTYFNYIKKLEPRTCIEIKPEDTVFINKSGKQRTKTLYFEPFLKNMENLVLGGKRMFIFVSSMSKLELLKERFIQIGIHAHKIATYSSKNKIDKLNNVNELWVQKDVVICTSSITVGVNFDIPEYFHSIGIYASATSRNLVRDMFQSIYRVRHLIDNVLYYTLDPRHHGINEPIFKNFVKQDLLTKEDLICDQFIKYKIDIETLGFENINNSWLENLLVNNILEYNLSIMKLEEEFEKYFIECNYIKDSNIVIPEFGELEVIEENIIIIPYETIPSITSDQMKILRKSESLTDLQEATLQKFFFQQTIENISLEDEKCCWNLYNDCGRNKFRNISYEKGIRSQSLNMGDIISITLPILAEKLSIRLEVIQNMTSWYGVDNSHDIKTISNDKLKLLVPIFKENIKEIYNAFDLRETRKKDKEDFNVSNVVDITKMVLNKWGFSDIKKEKRTQKKIKGKLFDNSSYSISTETPVYEKIKPKRRSKTKSPSEKKRLL